jgi:hypothetical protein
LRGIPVRVIGLPADRFVDHGSVSDLRHLVRLDVEGLAAQFRAALASVAAKPLEVTSA